MEKQEQVTLKFRCARCQAEHTVVHIGTEDEVRCDPEYGFPITCQCGHYYKKPCRVERFHYYEHKELA